MGRKKTGLTARMITDTDGSEVDNVQACAGNKWRVGRGKETNGKIMERNGRAGERGKQMEGEGREGN